jgi:hypothetical protein
MTKIVRSVNAGTQTAISQQHTQPFHICTLVLPSETVYLSEGPAMVFETHTYLEGRIRVGELRWNGEGVQGCTLEVYNDANSAASWFMANKIANATATVWLVHRDAAGNFTTPVKYAEGSCDTSELTPESLRMTLVTINTDRKFFPNTYLGTCGFNHMPQERAVVFWNNTTYVLERDYG